MFTSLREDAKRAAKDAVVFACVGMLIGLLMAVALCFLTFAAFVWAEDQYGPVVAGSGLGAFFLTFALAVFAVASLRRRSQSQRSQETRVELRQATASGQAPASGHKSVAMAAGTELLRLMGPRQNHSSISAKCRDSWSSSGYPTQEEQDRRSKVKQRPGSLCARGLGA